VSRFYNGRQGATHIVQAFVFGRELRIVGADDVILAVWKLPEIQSAPEVDPDGVVTLTARGQPGVLLIDDSPELETLQRAGIKLPGHKTWTRRNWIAVGACLLAVIGAGIAAVTTLPRWLAAAIPVAWEQRLGQPAAALITGTKSRCTGTAGEAALNRLVERLRAAGRIEMPVTIAVFDDRLVNAFTLPGGQVLVMHGLINDTTDGPMLAGVIAHELGHVAHRDAATMLLRSMGFAMLLQMVGLGDAGGIVASGASNLLDLSYSRAAEAAADATAIDLLTKAGLRADGLSRFFARMEQHTGVSETSGTKPADRSGITLDWFATHPSSRSRREGTARPETGEMPFTDAEWQAVRTICALQD
jgi:Zn-dependent protease with chaperone function